jgi:hypothetical protein
LRGTSTTQLCYLLKVFLFRLLFFLEQGEKKQQKAPKQAIPLSATPHKDE